MNETEACEILEHLIEEIEQEEDCIIQQKKIKAIKIAQEALETKMALHYV